jgi:adenylosuccinate synthase
MGRRGIRIAHLLDTASFRAAYDTLIEEKSAIARTLGIYEELDFARTREEYECFAARVRPMVCDTAVLLNRAIQDGKTVLFEGAQGTMLDIDHGTYPFVTSSSASAGGACTGSGVAPTRISGVVGVSKAYITRVGGGPFPTEVEGAQGELIRQRGNEFGAVTGRPRRCGWFDVPLLRYTAMINGFDSLVITKLDVLDTFETIPVCTGYRIAGKPIDEMPARVADVAKIDPVYECLPGWCSSTFGISSYDQLPSGAKDYLAFLEDKTGVEVGSISTGPERNQTIVRTGSRFAKLIG